MNRGVVMTLVGGSSSARSDEREGDRQTVVAKRFADADALFEARLRHELAPFESLELPGLLRPVGFERSEGDLVVLLERGVGEELEQLTSAGPLELDRFLTIAISLTTTLEAIHERGLLHHDLRPSNTWFEATVERTQLGAPGLPVALERERRALDVPRLLSSVLPYLAPEHSNRYRRPIDRRSDLYSLGATFYRLLSGSAPFWADSVFAMRQAHLSRVPRPLVNPPGLLAELVFKLLAKDPSDRYQSAAALREDLERFADAAASGQEDPSFELGADDRPASLMFPGRVVGVEPELRTLGRELAALQEQSGTRVVVVRGPAGSGKTALLEGFEATACGREGLFALAGFESGSGAVLVGEGAGAGPPGAALLEVLGLLAEQIMDHSEVAVARWREHLRERVGPVAPVIVELIPAFAPVFGELEPVPRLAPEAARRRLELALFRLLEAIGERVPVTLALDELEAIDPDGASLLEAIVEARLPLLLLLASTDAGLVPGGRAAALLERLRGFGCALRELALEPLRRADISELATRTFTSSPGELNSVDALVGLIERRSQGWAGRVRRCFTTLVERGLVGPSPFGWSWDVHTIERVELELDAEAWLARTQERLEPELDELLGLAACLGQRFSFAVLLRASGWEPPALVAGLTRLVNAGLLLAHGADYQFCPAIRAAVCASAAKDRRLRWELAVVEALDEADAPSVAIAAALDREPALAEALAAERRPALAERCAAAGRVTLERGVWHGARRYLELATRLVAPAPASVELACDHAVTLALSGDEELADARFGALLERSLESLDYARVVVARIRSLEAGERRAEALELGLGAMHRCGLDVDRRGGVVATGFAVGRAWLACRGLELEALLEAGPIREPSLRAALEIAAVTVDSAFHEDPRLFAKLVAARAERVARAGFDRTAPLALAQFALPLAMGLGRVETAARLCDLALELCDQVEDGAAARPRVTSTAMLAVWPLSRPLSECVASLVSCHREALEVGDVTVANYMAGVGLGLSIHAGAAPAELLELGQRWRGELERWSTPDSRAAVDGWLGIIAALADPRGEGRGFVSERTLDEAGLEPVVRTALTINEALARWLLGEREAAAALIEPLADELAELPIGSWQVPPGAAMVAIVTCDRADADDPLELPAARRRIRAALELARRYARSSWANYGAHVELIGAELDRVRGRVERALAGYERARELATDTDNFCMQGLICARLASLAVAADRRATARGAAVTGISALRRWGAEAAARQLESEHGELLALVVPGSRATGVGRSAGGRSGDGSRLAIDASTVLGVMHLISEELQLEEVIARVIGSSVSSAGVERGVLLLEHEGSVGLVAEGDGVDFELFVDDPVPLAEAGERVPRTIIEHTLESGAMIVIDDARADLRFAGDPYLQATKPCSLLCIPIARNADRVGVLMLENRVAAGAFPSERIEVLRILLTQAASALRHARLYEALQRSEVLFRSLVDGVPDMIALMDRDGRIEFVNHLAGFGLDPETLAGVDSTLLMDASCGPQWRAALEHVAATGERRELEVRANFPGGASRWYMVRLGALEYAGRIGKLISISTDITERKAAESDKLRLEAQLRQQQRLESVGTLASGVAHEINNPIQGIMNYADLIVGRASDMELVTDFASEILTESERVATIVRNLLAFSRQEAEQLPEACGVDRLVETTLSLIRAVVRKDDIELRLDLPDELHQVRCRFQQIQQIIMNLVANARDALNERYAEDGTRKTIDIRARNIEREGRRWVRISVEDCGTGIPEHIRARIFDPFFTTKGRDQGTGLGLAVSHGIAADHGGELWVESELGVGTTFHLELPAIGDG